MAKTCGANVRTITVVTEAEVGKDTLGTLSNRRRRPDDGNRKRDISFEMSLGMYNTL